MAVLQAQAAVAVAQFYKFYSLKQALIIFVRNPILGKVKTRLAKTIGDEKALLVYNKLLAHTHGITKQLPADKFVFYTDYINEDDLWENNLYEKHLQQGDDLGNRMQHAFQLLFAKGYTGIIIIGSDCYELTTEIIDAAFHKLQPHDLIIGPSTDGGYYLLGMKKLHNCLFEHKAWSTVSVLNETINDAKMLELTYALLPSLNDIDDGQDLYKSGLAIP